MPFNVSFHSNDLNKYRLRFCNGHTHFPTLLPTISSFHIHTLIDGIVLFCDSFYLSHNFRCIYFPICFESNLKSQTSNLQTLFQSNGSSYTFDLVTFVISLLSLRDIKISFAIWLTHLSTSNSMRLHRNGKIYWKMHNK